MSQKSNEILFLPWKKGRTECHFGQMFLFKLFDPVHIFLKELLYCERSATDIFVIKSQTFSRHFFCTPLFTSNYPDKCKMSRKCHSTVWKNNCFEQQLPGLMKQHSQYSELQSKKESFPSSPYQGIIQMNTHKGHTLHSLTVK